MTFAPGQGRMERHLASHCNKSPNKFVYAKNSSYGGAGNLSTVLEYPDISRGFFGRCSAGVQHPDPAYR
jgi:hypothetical protein